MLSELLHVCHQVIRGVIDQAGSWRGLPTASLIEEDDVEELWIEECPAVGEAYLSVSWNCHGCKAGTGGLKRLALHKSEY